MPVPARDLRQTTAVRILEDELARRRLRNPRYSIAAFARFLGTSQTQLSMVLLGRRRVSDRLSLRILCAFSSQPEILETWLAALLEGSAAQPKLHAFGMPNGEDPKFNLRRGVLVSASDWPNYRSAVEAIFADSAHARLAVKLLPH